MYDCNIDTLYTYISARKEISQVFEIPFHVKDSGEPIKPWSDVQKRQSILIDLRTEVTKANVRLGRNVHTYKTGYCNVWQDRPQLISFERVPYSEWRTSVHSVV